MVLRFHSPGGRLRLGSAFQRTGAVGGAEEPPCRSDGAPPVGSREAAHGGLV